MKKTSYLIVFLVALLAVTPALAREHEPNGDRIFIKFSGSQIYPANTAFHLWHGWFDIVPWMAAGQIRFELELDDIIVPPTYFEYDTIVTENGPLFERNWFFNF